jgi:uncharacterized repeat protein (TIGR02543 family)
LASGFLIAPAEAAPSPGSSCASPTPVNTSFSYTGGPQTFTVPTGVTALDIAISGTSGGDYIVPAYTEPPLFPGDPTQSFPESVIPGGAGAAFTTKDIAVRPGESLTVIVGGAGADVTSSVGGGQALGGGGGSFVYSTPTVAGLLVAAGGGGGAGYGTTTPGGNGVTSPAGDGLGGAGGRSITDSGGGGGGGLLGDGQDGAPGNGGGYAPATTGGTGGQGAPAFTGGTGGTEAGLPYAGSAGGFGGGGGGGASTYEYAGGGGGGGFTGGAGGTGAPGAGGTSYSVGAMVNIGTNTGDGSVTISYTPSVTATFDTQGGSTAPAPETVEPGCPVTAPADPTRSGYTFAGWSTAPAGGSAWDFTNPLNADTTLYAQWTPVKLAQTITVASDPGSPQAGTSYTPDASSTSGLPVAVTVSASSAGACHVNGAQVDFDTPGDCEIDYNQAGNSTYAAADEVTQQVSVAAIPTTVTVSTQPSSPLFGQPVTAQVTGSDTGTGDSLAGSFTVSVDGTKLPAVATAGGTASLPLTTVAGDPLPAGSHTLEVAFRPTDANHADAATTSTLVVDPAGTTTELSITGQAITATVAAAAPGQGTPTGQVTFAVGGRSVGTAPVVDGVATLDYVVPPGAQRTVSATYSGDADWTASSTSTVRNDPTITAVLSSAKPKSRAGWYRTPVTVTFTCTTHGAELVGGCPAPVRLTRSAGGQAVSRTITAADGGVATAAVTGIDIDRIAPRLRVAGLHAGYTYAAAPAPVCRTRDAVSGVASCRITRRVVARHPLAKVYAYRAVATDRAGNHRAVTGRYRLLTAVFAGVPFRHGAFTVHPGHTYTLVVQAAGRPVYYDAAVAPRRPTRPDKGFLKAGHRRWALGVTMTRGMRAHPLWNIGIKTAGVLRIIHIRIA